MNNVGSVLSSGPNSLESLAAVVISGFRARDYPIIKATGDRE